LNALSEGEDYSYQVEGIGYVCFIHYMCTNSPFLVRYDFIPDVLSREPGLINHWVKINDAESFKSVREMMKLEALLVGGSCGTAIAGALSWLQGAPGRDVEGQNVVIMLPDG
jgi:cystathionine beta-synthase